MKGSHVIADFWGCSFDLLDDLNKLRESLVIAANLAHATVIDTITHKFTPQGVTILVLLSESHISIHTTPEDGYASFDCYTCGDTCNPELGFEYIRSVLQPKSYRITKLDRGENPQSSTSLNWPVGATGLVLQ